MKSLCTHKVTLYAMKEITLQVPENKYHQFLKIVQEMGIEISEETIIPEEHKKIVRERIQSVSPDQVVTWDEARKQFTYKE